MKEIGFWDYTCPLNGSLEYYTQSDWDLLLDDMCAGGFNSLVLSVKWLTTGYRSRYPWLDQDPNCSAIASDNAVIHHAMQGARQRGIRTRLLVVGSIYPSNAEPLPHGKRYWTDDFVVYDLDTPGLDQRLNLLFGEIVDLFGAETDGLVVELEFCDGESDHRVPVYNRWAQQNNRPDFAAIKNFSFESRFYPYTHWRDFTTTRRIETLQGIEQQVRSKGFSGELSSIIEIDNQHGAVLSNVNMAMLRDQLPGWPVVTYDSIYDRRRNRLATMDFCVHQPREFGLSPYYLTRGVMTFHVPPELGPTNLPEQWRMQLEDAYTHQPDILWFMGADCCREEAMVCSRRELPEWGYPDGITARRQLMKMASEILR